MLGARPTWLDQAEKQLIQQGLTNQTYRLSYEGRFYFYRQSIPSPERVFIQRSSESVVLQAVSSLGITPDVHFFADDGQEMLMSWVHEPKWDAGYFSSNEGISKLAGLCSLIHSLAPAIKPLSLPNYLNQLSANLPQVPDTVEKAKRSMLTWLQRLSPVKPVLCHNDINPANLLGKKPWLIDWEYSALGDPAFELAGIANVGQFNADQLNDLIQSYQETGLKIDLRRVQQMRYVVDLVGFYWCERMLVLRPENESQYRGYQTELIQRIEDI